MHDFNSAVDRLIKAYEKARQRRIAKRELAEAVSSIEASFERLCKFNPYHDERGRFAESPGGGADEGVSREEKEFSDGFKAVVTDPGKADKFKQVMEGKGGTLTKIKALYKKGVFDGLPIDTMPAELVKEYGQWKEKEYPDLSKPPEPTADDKMNALVNDDYLKGIAGGIMLQKGLGTFLVNAPAFSIHAEGLTNAELEKAGYEIYKEQLEAKGYGAKAFGTLDAFRELQDMVHGDNIDKFMNINTQASMLANAYPEAFKDLSGSNISFALTQLKMAQFDAFFASSSLFSPAFQAAYADPGKVANLKYALNYNLPSYLVNHDDVAADTNQAEELMREQAYAQDMKSSVIYAAHLSTDDGGPNDQLRAIMDNPKIYAAALEKLSDGPLSVFNTMVTNTAEVKLSGMNPDVNPKLVADKMVNMLFNAFASRQSTMESGEPAFYDMTSKGFTGAQMLEHYVQDSKEDFLKWCEQAADNPQDKFGDSFYHAAGEFAGKVDAYTNEIPKPEPPQELVEEKPVIDSKLQTFVANKYDGTETTKGYFVTMPGYEHQFFVGKSLDDPNLWLLSEYKSGMSTGIKGSTPEETVKAAVEKFKELGPDKVNAAIESGQAAQGEKVAKAYEDLKEPSTKAPVAKAPPSDMKQEDGYSIAKKSGFYATASGKESEGWIVKIPGSDKDFVLAKDPSSYFKWQKYLLFDKETGKVLTASSSKSKAIDQTLKYVAMHGVEELEKKIGEVSEEEKQAIAEKNKELESKAQAQQAEMKGKGKEEKDFIKQGYSIKGTKTDTVKNSGSYTYKIGAYPVKFASHPDVQCYAAKLGYYWKVFDAKSGLTLPIQGNHDKATALKMAAEHLKAVDADFFKKFHDEHQDAINEVSKKSDELLSPKDPEPSSKAPAQPEPYKFNMIAQVFQGEKAQAVVAKIKDDVQTKIGKYYENKNHTMEDRISYIKSKHGFDDDDVKTAVAYYAQQKLKSMAEDSDELDTAIKKGNGSLSGDVQYNIYNHFKSIHDMYYSTGDHDEFVSKVEDLVGHKDAEATIKAYLQTSTAYMGKVKNGGYDTVPQAPTSYTPKYNSSGIVVDEFIPTEDPPPINMIKYKNFPDGHQILKDEVTPVREFKKGVDPKGKELFQDEHLSKAFDETLAKLSGMSSHQVYAEWLKDSDMQGIRRCAGDWQSNTKMPGGLFIKLLAKITENLPGPIHTKQESYKYGGLPTLSTMEHLKDLVTPKFKELHTGVEPPSTINYAQHRAYAYAFARADIGKAGEITLYRGTNGHTGGQIASVCAALKAAGKTPEKVFFQEDALMGGSTSKHIADKSFGAGTGGVTTKMRVLPHDVVMPFAFLNGFSNEKEYFLGNRRKINEYDLNNIIWASKGHGPGHQGF